MVEFMLEVLFGVRIPAETGSLKFVCNGIRPLFPPLDRLLKIDDICNRLGKGLHVSASEIAENLVNEEKTWFDKQRRVNFDGLVPDQMLHLVSGHCWRGGQPVGTC